MFFSRQVLRSGTSVGAHVREGRRSHSDAELISKIEVGLQELEETVYWLELLVEADMVKPNQMVELLTEADELTSILVTGVRTISFGFFNSTGLSLSSIRLQCSLSL